MREEERSAWLSQLQQPAWPSSTSALAEKPVAGHFPSLADCGNPEQGKSSCAASVSCGDYGLSVGGEAGGASGVQRSFCRVNTHLVNPCTSRRLYVRGGPSPSSAPLPLSALHPFSPPA